MFIKIPKDTFEFGDSIPAEVIFVNTSGNPLILPEDPAKSVELLVHAVNVQTREDLNYSVAEIIINESADGRIAMTVPVKHKFEILPKSLYFFTTDLNKRLYLSPGNYQCFLVNYLIEKSNCVTITVSFTTNSVLYLLNIAVDERVSYGKREWAFEWLKKVNPDLKLHLTLDKDTEAQKREKIAFNEQSYKHFKCWWETSQKDPECIQKILRLNQN